MPAPCPELKDLVGQLVSGYSVQWVMKDGIRILECGGLMVTHLCQVEAALRVAERAELAAAAAADAAAFAAAQTGDDGATAAPLHTREVSQAASGGGFSHLHLSIFSLFSLSSL